MEPSYCLNSAFGVVAAADSRRGATKCSRQSRPAIGWCAPGRPDILDFLMAEVCKNDKLRRRFEKKEERGKDYL